MKARGGGGAVIWSSSGGGGSGQSLPPLPSSASWLARRRVGVTPCGPRTGEGGGSGDQEGSWPRGLRVCHAGGCSDTVRAGEGSRRLP